MIPANILIVLFVLLVVAAAWAILAGLGAKIAAKRARLVEPRYPGNSRAFSQAEQRALHAAMGRASKLAWHRWDEKHGN